MLKALKKEPGASNEEDGNASGIRNKFAHKITAPLRRLTKGGKHDENPPSQATHKPVFPARNIPQGVSLDGEDSSRHYRARPKKTKHEKRETRNHREQQYGISARERDAEFLKYGPTELTRLYRPLSINMSKTRKRRDEDIEYYGRYQFEELDFADKIGHIVTFRARIHTIRRLSTKLIFLIFRQQTTTIQGVLQAERPDDGRYSQQNKDPNSDGNASAGIISEQMVRAVLHYPLESIVLVKGKIRSPPEPVHSTTIHDAEIQVHELHLISQLSEHVPFSVYEAENIEKFSHKEGEESGESDEEISGESSSRSSQNSARDSHSSHESHSSQSSLENSSRGSDGSRHNKALPQTYRLNNRIVDLRTTSSQSIFRIQSGIGNMFRTYLDSQGFIEIHTPKLQASSTESGASVFEVNYFGRPVYLAQSPQLAKQMCIAADFERVYEIGAVFRAENSNTPRHLTEYTGLDLEMAFEEHYHETLDLIDEMFKTLWKGLYERYSREIELISQFYPHETLLWRDETPRLSFSEGIKLLLSDGWTDDDGNSPSETEDLPTRAEIRLGQLVRERFKSDYYILDKFPASARPFYTMPDPSNENFTNSFDIFLRGQEILSGGQRIHDPGCLEKRMRKLGVEPETMDDYMEGFRWGAPPHAGAGIGLERLTYLFLSLGNIRLASLFPRDPKSLPRRIRCPKLRHPEASTTDPPWADKTSRNQDTIPKIYQPLEKLIANYGDAANTSWLDERYEHWRHTTTGAIQGFVPYHGFAITVGEPLCAKSQYPQVVSAYLDFIKTERRHLKPLWLMAGPAIEEFLGVKCNWRTLSPVAENRVDPHNNFAAKDRDIARKMRHAEREGVKNFQWPKTTPLPDELKERINKRIDEWKARRKAGAQVHLTEIRPWIDEEHRRYFYAADGSRDGRVHALLVLHQLSPQNGYQVKFLLEFPGAPSGTIESLNMFAMAAIVTQEPDVKSITYGTGATDDVVGGRNMGKGKLKLLKRSYEMINKRLRLTNKTEFREKLGASKDRVYVCYPWRGLGPGGIKTIVDFMQEERGT
ncbi:hypothetical protein V493_03460 [Pseudogymnoascus sp. VKM F-4281 (FW-2241)]|nr:hypothetical protein V493_03460 [Pseudogymnoascus sp. VKM F-4281 (FW-2241)]